MILNIQFESYDDGYYFLCVTDQIRIETDGQQGLVIEDRQGEVHTIPDPMKYLTIEQHEDEYFQASLVEPYLTTIIEAVKTLYRHLNKEYPDDYPSAQ